MTITDPRAQRVAVQQGFLIVDLVDGRRLSVPVEWFPRLSTASQAQRDAWELMDEGRGIRWPSIDEDISVDGLLRGGRDTSKHALGRRPGGT
jgi:hypothetical protein